MYAGAYNNLDVSNIYLSMNYIQHGPYEEYEQV